MNSSLGLDASIFENRSPKDKWVLITKIDILKGVTLVSQQVACL